MVNKWSNFACILYYYYKNLLFYIIAINMHACQINIMCLSALLYRGINIPNKYFKFNYDPVRTQQTMLNDNCMPL